MATLSEVVGELDVGQTYDELIAEVMARKVTTYSIASGADISGVLLSVGLLSLIEDQCNLTGEHTPLRNMSIALSKRFGPDGQVNFGAEGNVQVLDAFIADPTVSAMLAAQGISNEYIKGVILGLAAVETPEFPSVSANEIVAIRDPSLVATVPVESSVSDVVAGGRELGIGLSVVLNTAAPIDTALEVFIATSVDNVAFTGFRYAGAIGVRDAGVYSVSINPQLTQAYNKVKLVSRSYNLDFTLGTVTAY